MVEQSHQRVRDIPSVLEVLLAEGVEGVGKWGGMGRWGDGGMDELAPWGGLKPMSIAEFCPNTGGYAVFSEESQLLKPDQLHRDFQSEFRHVLS